MKISRLNKLKSIVLLITIIWQTIYPTAALALADGVSQPDFESYEEFGSTDMVNLITGGFTYNLPLLNVPSPEGGYQVPLSYHAGIETNEESTWVGLGWSLNAGALTRNVNSAADDNKGQIVATNVTNPGSHGWIRPNQGGGYTHWDSQTGYGGKSSFLGLLEQTWGNEGESFGIAPLGLTFKDNDPHNWTWDSEYMAQGLTSVILMAISSGGGANIAKAYSYGTGAYLTLTSRSMGSYNVGKWTVQQKVSQSGLSQSVEYTRFLNSTTANAQYGSLYLGEMPIGTNFGFDDNITVHNDDFSSNSGDAFGNRARYYSYTHSTPLSVPTSDMFYNYTGANYAETFNPSSLAYDNYLVKGPGVTGIIQPYREDIGSLSNPIVDRESHICYVGPRFLSVSDYKVQFKYKDDNSNSYTNHNMSGNLNSQAFKYVIDDTQLYGDQHKLKVKFVDPKVHLDYPAVYPAPNGNAVTQLAAYNANFNASDKTELNNRDGRYNNKLAHGKHIEWFTNADVYNNSAAAKGFINTHQPFIRTWSALRPIMAEQIAGFSVTNEDGYTYHYAIPVYNKNETFLSKDGATKYIVSNPNYYATSWLLTGITGSDFVDRANNGIIDDNDWGYWVKFDYGQFASNYQWRNPYWGYDKGTTCKIGVKETYYLDKITTRTHTALFVKSYKSDGKSFYETDGCLNDFGHNPVDFYYPSSSLKLNDIYVLANADYQALTTSNGPYQLSLANSSAENNTVRNSDTYSNVLDNYDIARTGSILSFLSAYQIQQIHFNYDNNLLCKKTYNSFDFDGSGYPPTNDAVTPPANTSVLKGKLALRSVEFFGKNHTRTMPSYVFTYGNEFSQIQNPDYHPAKWDTYGMYKSGGIVGGSMHNCENKGDQWCLTNILTPLGGEIEVEYERDTYTSVNGHNLSETPLKFFGGWTCSGTGPIYNLGLSEAYFGNTNVFDYLSQNDEIWMKNFTTNSWQYVGKIANTTTYNSGGYVHLSIDGSVSPTFATEIVIKTKKRYGGDIRVKTINTKDENGHIYKTKYIYTKDGLETGESSGVASFEGEAERSSMSNFRFYDLYQHPMTSVLYSKVTVVDGQVNSTFNQTSKQSYEFITPNESLLSHSIDWVWPDQFCHFQTVAGNNLSISWSRAMGTHNIIDRTSAIGSLKSVKTYNQFDNLVAKTSIEYTDNSTNEYQNNMGSYTENTFLWEQVHYDDNSSHRYYKQRMFQTYVLKRPNILKSVTTQKDRLTSKYEVITYDYLTASPLVTRNTYGNFEKYENEVKPAYRNYSALGSKIYSPDNKNMMASIAEQYSYVYDKNNQKKVLGASAMTWAKNQLYRQYSGSSYQSAALPTVSGPYQTVWLPQQTFGWKSAVEENGTIKGTFVPFGTASNNWIATSAVNVYDHFSHPVQSIGIDFKPSSAKYGYNNSYNVASCANVKYTAWCYSGAEDKSPDANYYDGEVGGSNYQFKSSSYAHTGDYCTRMLPWQTGFSYKIKYSDLPNSKKYRASVWVHQNGVQNARLDCIGYDNSSSSVYFGGATFYGLTNVLSSTIEQAGSWYLFNLDFDLSQIPLNTEYIEIKVQNTNPQSQQYVYADDFRVHPINSPIVSNVYEPKTGRLTATLDNENYAVKYLYNAAGKITSVYKETKLGFKLVSSSDYHFSR